MRSALAHVEALTPDATAVIVGMAERRPLAPFAPVTLAFIERLSKGILTGGAFRAYPEMIAFGHWIRRKQILDLKTLFDLKRADTMRAGRGTVLHFAPSNVDTIFLYSFVISLLMGNANVVRLSRKRTPQVSAVIDAINAALKDDAFTDIRARLALVSFEHDAAITAALSSLCDLRVVWGGDQTVATIRAVALPPQARDLCFPDKWSIAVFDAARIAHESADAQRSLARNFVNDTYWFGQMACSSPRMVVWRGAASQAEAVSQLFWPLVEAEIGRFANDIAPIDMVNKLVAADTIAIGQSARVRHGASNLLDVVRLARIDRLPLEEHCGAGLFYEAIIDDLTPITQLIGRKLQTIVTHGIDAAEWRDVLASNPPRGIDRIVPVGQALAFSTVWDGYDLPIEFTREISLPLA